MTKRWVLNLKPNALIFGQIKIVKNFSFKRTYFLIIDEYPERMLLCSELGHWVVSDLEAVVLCLKRMFAVLGGCRGVL